MQKRTRYILPNLFTGLNFMLGIFSILMAATASSSPEGFQNPLLGKEPIPGAAWMITWCVLMDKLDGLAAKVMNASSGFGAQFDSLADLVAFGIAPGFLVFFYVRHSSPEWAAAHLRLLLLSITLYSLCTAMRLARYNAKDADELGNYFLGLPSTFAGGLAALSVILFEEYQVGVHFEKAYYILPMALIVLGILMVSPLYLPKLVKRKATWLNWTQIIATTSGYICGFGMIFPEYLLALLIIYGATGFTFCLLNKNLIFEKNSEGSPVNPEIRV